MHPIVVRTLPSKRRHRGATLIEIMIALLIVSFGILGVAGIQANVIADTQNSSLRGLVAMQATSLSMAMHANRTFWAGGLAPASFTTSGSTVTDASGLLSATVPSCKSSTVNSPGNCTPAQLAGWDVQQWAANLTNLLPSATSSVACTTSTLTPLACTITVTWTERFVALTPNAVSASASTSGSRSYTMYVNP